MSNDATNPDDAENARAIESETTVEVPILKLFTAADLKLFRDKANDDDDESSIEIASPLLQEDQPDRP